MADLDAIRRDPDLVRHVHLTNQEKVLLARDPSMLVRRDLATYCWSLPLEAENILRRDPDVHVRVGLAKNYGVCLESLRVLARDARSVAWVVAVRSGLPGEVQEDLSFHPTDPVRRMLSRNSSLQVTSRMSPTFVREADPEAYARLVGDVDSEVVNSLAPGWAGTLEGLVEAARLVAR